MPATDPKNTDHQPVKLLQVFLNNQSKELELKNQELEFAKQKDTNSFEHSKIVISAQLQDLADQRKHNSKMWSSLINVVLCGIVALTTVSCFALYLGREQFVLELIRVVFYGGCGAVAGSYYQKSKNQEPKK
jgi:hypothetical protein